MRIYNQSDIRIDKLIIIGQGSIYLGLLILTLRHIWLYPAHNFAFVAIIMGIGFLPSLFVRRLVPSFRPYLLVANALLIVSCVFSLLEEWALSGLFMLVPVYSLLFQQSRIYFFSTISSILVYMILSFVIFFENDTTNLQLVTFFDIITTFLILVLIIYFVFKDIRWRNVHEVKHLQTIFTLSLTVEARDPYTQGHSQRVAFLAKRIAERIPELDAELVYNSGLIHDVGKLSISDSILQNENRMSDEEYEMMKTHTTTGAKLCKNLNISEEIVLGVLHHHERYDGTGYPEGLKGEEIPLIGRVISVADAIDAMCSNRSYRKALAIDQVHTELERCSYSQFDPEIIEIVQQIWGEISFYYETGEV